jgi:TetR/AcrR family transcriptional repressor of nem operon
LAHFGPKASQRWTFRQGLTQSCGQGKLHTDWLVCKTMSRIRNRIGTRNKILDVALNVIRTKGYSATTVDEICAAAGLTKGAFFHHFENKDKLGIAAAEHFASMADGIFASAPYRNLEDPRDRLLGYVDFRAAILDRDIPEFSCLLGTMVQEVYITHPDIRAACNIHMTEHIEMLVQDIQLAKEKYAPDATWTAHSLAYFMQSVLQGAFIFAKATDGSQVVSDSLEHLRQYLKTVFNADTPQQRSKQK